MLVDSQTPGQILGFYSLSAAQIDGADLTPADRKNCLDIQYLAFGWVDWRAARIGTPKAWESC